MESMSELLMRRIGTGEKLRKQDSLSSNKDSLTTPTSIFKCDACKDVKVVFFKDEEGIERTRNCECLENELKENRYRKLKEFSEMPLHLKELRLKDFRVDIYDNQEKIPPTVAIIPSTLFAVIFSISSATACFGILTEPFFETPLT